VSDQLNPFQRAVVRFRQLGGRGIVRFLQGNSEKTGRGAPSIDCEVGDDHRPVQILIEGYGYAEGANLDEVVEVMAKRLPGYKKPAPFVESPVLAEPAPSKKSKK